MAQFPTREADVKELAQNIATGLTSSATIYPAPPVTSAELQAALDAVIALGDYAVAARAAAQEATDGKAAGLAGLTDAMKAVLRYAEDTVDYDDTKLKLLGWGGRAEAQPLAVPGQTRNLEVPRQGEGWVFWIGKKPIDGGAVASYKIERRERPSGSWILISVALESEAMLTNQERNKDWEYRVIAVNKAGEGIPSNTVAAVV